VLLAIDIGNTQTVLGIFDGARLERSWRISSRREMTADEVGVLLAGLLAPYAGRVRDAVLGSVVPPLTGGFVQAVQGLGVADLLEVAPGVRTGLQIKTENPQEVGADRIVNAVAVHEHHPCPAVAIDLGTATTLDVITAAGEYLGGIICPGPGLGADALALRTARLLRVDLTVPARVIGRSSVEAIRSGLLYGHAAMVDGLVRRIEDELDSAVTVVVTGGLADRLVPLMTRVDVSDPHLTLEGLRIVHRRNRQR
jgi:type III pantothenate kinase